MAKLTIWNKPDSDEVRIYVNLRHDTDAARLGYAGADGAYIKADADGMAVMSYKLSHSGYYGEGALAFANAFHITGARFDDVLERVRNAVGPRGGKFSERVYFDNLTEAPRCLPHNATE